MLHLSHTCGYNYASPTNKFILAPTTSIAKSRSLYAFRASHSWKDIRTPRLSNWPNSLTARWLTTKDLVKCLLIVRTHWSGGMLSALIFKYDTVYSKKFLNELNARRDWALWKYAHDVIWKPSSAEMSIFTPWSIRIRRFFQIAGSSNTDFITVRFNHNKFTTPRRRIKRWLKKKYTTRSWR